MIGRKCNLILQNSKMFLKSTKRRMKYLSGFVLFVSIKMSQSQIRLNLQAITQELCIKLPVKMYRGRTPFFSSFLTLVDLWIKCQLTTSQATQVQLTRSRRPKYIKNLSLWRKSKSTCSCKNKTLELKSSQTVN